MSASDRRVREVFIELSDTLVDDFDIIEFLDRLAVRCSELLGVSACGIMLVDHYGALNLVAASTEQARLVELTQVQNLEGPCLDAFTTGRPVQQADLRAADVRWPRFAAAAVEAGYLAVQGIPMRLRDTVLGAVNLLSEVAEPLSVIEQAKGFLTHSLSVGVDEAFAVLRAYARENNRRLTDVAEDLVQGRLSIHGADSASDAPPP